MGIEEGDGIVFHSPRSQPATSVISELRPTDTALVSNDSETLAGISYIVSRVKRRAGLLRGEKTAVYLYRLIGYASCPIFDVLGRYALKIWLTNSNTAQRTTYVDVARLQK